jgi:hypothetical protein
LPTDAHGVDSQDLLIKRWCDFEIDYFVTSVPEMDRREIVSLRCSGRDVCGGKFLHMMVYIRQRECARNVESSQHISLRTNRQHIRSTQNSGAKHHPITTSSPCTTPRSFRTPLSPLLRRWQLLLLPLPTVTSQGSRSMERPTQDRTLYVLPVKLGRSNTD